MRTRLALYCLLFGTTSLGSFLPSFGADAAGVAEARSLTEFTAEKADGFVWQVVDDGVMGGLSKGKLGFTAEGTIRFEGILSLENNGGFSSIRTARFEPLDLSGHPGLRLRVKGDGRSYQLRLESDARTRGTQPVSFTANFATTKGEWKEIEVSFRDFTGGWRGQALPDAKLNSATIERIGLVLADKQPGPFALEVDWIRVAGK